jgi:hypothetical protein
MSSGTTNAIIFGLSNYFSSLVRNLVSSHATILNSIKTQAQKYDGLSILSLILIKDILKELTKTSTSAKELIDKITPKILSNNLSKRSVNIRNTLKFLFKFVSLRAEEQTDGFIFNVFLLLAGIPLCLTGSIEYSFEIFEILKKDGSWMVSQSEIEAIESLKVSVDNLSTKKVDIIEFFDILAYKVINKPLDLIKEEIETLEKLMSPIPVDQKLLGCQIDTESESSISSDDY